MNNENEKIEITKENIMQLGFFNTIKDISSPDGTNIKKGTEFLVEKNYEDLRYEVHFSQDERNNYNSEFGDNYLFSLDEIKSFAEPTENSIKKFEVENLLKESLVEDEVKSFFYNENIPFELRNDKNFVSLVIDKFYVSNDIYNLEQTIKGDFFDGSSPDDINSFYSQTKEFQNTALSNYQDETNKSMIEYHNSIEKLEKINSQIEKLVKEYPRNKEEVINAFSGQVEKSIEIDKYKEFIKYESANAAKSNWLLSKLNIRNEKVLERIEKIIVGVNNIKLSLNPVKGELNFKHLNDINKSLYGCLYTLPEIPIDKINSCKSILKELKNEKLTKTKDINDFVDKTTKHISKLYDMNVFEKGNVATLKEFTRSLGMCAGFNIDFSKVSNSDFEFSCIKGNLGTLDNLNKLINDNTINFEPQKNIMREFIKYIGIER